MVERAIVGLCGQKGSGKSTAAQHLKKVYGAAILSFASPLKKANQVLFGFQHDQLYGTDTQKQTLDPFLGVSGRDLLQWTGTEIFRNNKMFAVENETIWIANMRERIAQVKDPYQDIVIDDVRFPDEAEFISSIGGTTFCIYRPVRETEVVELDDDITPPLPTEFYENMSAPAEMAGNPLFHALAHVVPGWISKTQEEQSIMMMELDKELNLLPKQFPMLPWMGKGYVRPNIRDARKIMYPDFMTFWMAMRNLMLPFREPSHSYSVEHESHVSEKMAFVPNETVLNDGDLQAFEERVFGIIPMIHNRKLIEAQMRLR